MTVLAKAVRSARELWPVLLIAVAVVGIGTVTGSVLDKQHRAQAGELIANDVVATAGPDSTQILAIPSWGMTASFPLATELPLLKYSPHGDSLGLTSADLEKLGSACVAANGPLGSLMRFPAGTAAIPGPGGVTRQLIKTEGNYDYVYQMPQTDCAKATGGSEIINRETSIIPDALSSLSPVTRP